MNGFTEKTFDFACHPGETLKEKLMEMSMSVKEFALRTGKPEKSVIDIIDGTQSVTTETALLMEKVTWIPAGFWLAKQRNYDEYVLRQKTSRHGGNELAWLRTLPLQEMVEKGWLELGETDSDQVEKALHFFGVASPAAWKDVYFLQKLKVAFRISLGKTANPGAVAAWLRRGEIQSMDMYLDRRYAPKRLKSLLPEISLLLQSPPDTVIGRLTALLADAGIKLLFTESLSGVPIKGATRWIYGWPSIQLLSERQEYEDFRFTVLHEIGHILLHGKKDIFLEQAGFTPDDDPAYTKKEQEADVFARKWMENQP